MGRFRPAEETHLFILDDEAVLYSHLASEIYWFNTAATLIWCSLELGHSRPETATALASAIGCSHDEAQRHIAAALTRWDALGVLAGSDTIARKLRPRPEPPAISVPNAALPPCLPMSAAIERQYQLLATNVLVRFATAAQEVWVHPVLAHLEHREPTSHATVSVANNDGIHCIYLDGLAYARCTRHEELAPLVEAAVRQPAIKNHRYLLYIHAGVVCDGGSVILMPAPSGRGKSTLTAGLMHAGFQYFSDEVALLEEGSFHTASVSLSLCVKSTAWDRLAPLFPELRDLAEHQRPDGKIVKYLPPPARALPKDRKRSAPVRRIVFPYYDPSAKTVLRSLSKGEALHRLLDQCLALPLDLDFARVEALVRWISRIECSELIISSLEEGVRILSATPPTADDKGPAARA